LKKITGFKPKIENFTLCQNVLPKAPKNANF
jgi:hypothetical protein